MMNLILTSQRIRLLLCVALFWLLPKSSSADNLPKRELTPVLVVRGGHAYDTPHFEDMCRRLPNVKCHLVLTAHLESMLAEEIAGKYDTILFLNQNKKYEIEPRNKRRYMQLAELGVGMVFLHFTLSSHPHWDEYHKIVGGKWSFKQFEKNKDLHSTYFQNMTVDIKIANRKHPVTKRLTDFRMTDAFYGNIHTEPNVQPLLSANDSRISRTLAWTHQFKKSKIVYIMPGFTQQAYNNGAYQRLLSNALVYVASSKPY